MGTGISRGGGVGVLRIRRPKPRGGKAVLGHGRRLLNLLMLIVEAAAA